MWLWNKIKFLKRCVYIRRNSDNGHVQHSYLTTLYICTNGAWGTTKCMWPERKPTRKDANIQSTRGSIYYTNANWSLKLTLKRWSALFGVWNTVASVRSNAVKSCGLQTLTWSATHFANMSSTSDNTKFWHQYIASMLLLHSSDI